MPSTMQKKAILILIPFLLIFLSGLFLFLRPQINAFLCLHGTSVSVIVPHYFIDIKEPVTPLWDDRLLFCVIMCSGWMYIL